MTVHLSDPLNAAFSLTATAEDMSKCMCRGGDATEELRGLTAESYLIVWSLMSWCGLTPEDMPSILKARGVNSSLPDPAFSRQTLRSLTFEHARRRLLFTPMSRKVTGGTAETLAEALLDGGLNDFDASHWGVYFWSKNGEVGVVPRYIKHWLGRDNVKTVENVLVSMSSYPDLKARKTSASHTDKYIILPADVLIRGIDLRQKQE